MTAMDASNQPYQITAANGAVLFPPRLSRDGQLEERNEGVLAPARLAIRQVL
jgi:hypothetical protein